MARMNVRLIRVDSRRVFNLTSPRWLPEASRLINDWHSPRYEPLRDLIEKVYVDTFNRQTGHYAKLEDSIARDGVYNPVVLTSGPLLYRQTAELPEHVRDDGERLVCEYVGGSRLYIARRLGLEVPAIVNDAANLFPDAELIPYGSNVEHLFKDQPHRREWKNNGSLYLNFFALGHFPANERTTRRRMQRTDRARVVAETLKAVSHWRKRYD